MHALVREGGGPNSVAAGESVPCKDEQGTDRGGWSLESVPYDQSPYARLDAVDREDIRSPMSNLSNFLRQLRELHRQYLELEREIGGDHARASRSPRPKPKRRHEPTSGASDQLRAVVKVLRDARHPLSRREIAARLNITPRACGRRLAKAIEVGFVKRIGFSLYQVVDEVPEILS